MPSEPTRDRIGLRSRETDPVCSVTPTEYTTSLGSNSQCEIKQDFQNQLRDRVGDLEDRLDEELVHSRRIFENIIDRLDSLEEDVRTVNERQDWVRDWRSSHRRLVELTSQAVDIGATLAKCERCGKKIRLGLLTAPECPGCAEQFVALEDERGRFGMGSVVVSVIPEQTLGRNESPAGGDDVQDESGDYRDYTTGFIWGEDRS